MAGLGAIETLALAFLQKMVGALACGVRPAAIAAFRLQCAGASTRVGGSWPLAAAGTCCHSSAPEGCTNSQSGLLCCQQDGLGLFSGEPTEIKLEDAFLVLANRGGVLLVLVVR